MVTVSLFTCPGTRKSKSKVKACSCPGEGLVPASVQGSERDRGGVGRHWKEMDKSAGLPAVILVR